MSRFFNDMDDVSEALAVLKAKKQSGNPVVRKMKKSFFDPKQFRDSINMEFRNNKKDLGTAAWDVLASFMMYLKENHITKNLVAYGECVCELIKASSPKEVYIGVLEQYDPSTDFRYIEMLHPALELILTKYVESEPNSCAVSFETTLSTMLCYLDTFNKPEFEYYDPTEPLDKVYENLKCLKYMERTLSLIRPATTNLLLRRKEIKKVARFKSFCFQFTCHFSMMLPRLDTDIVVKQTTEKDGDSKNEDSTTKHAPCHTVVHDVYGLKTQLHSVAFLFDFADWVALHPHDSFTTPEGMPEITRQILHGRASFLYFVLCRGIRYDELPKVYSATGMICRTLCEVNALLTWQAPIVLWKAMELLSYVVQRTAKSSISCDEILYYISLDYCGNAYIKKPKRTIRDLLENLCTVAASWNLVTIRRQACKLLTQVIEMFCWRDKILSLTYVFRNFKECGVVGYMIGYLKDKLDEVLRDDPPEGSDVFCNQKRMKMIGTLIFHLPNGTDTDLLENCDKIMAALNLLRFLLIRDKKNQTGIFDNLSIIQKTYVEALRFNIEVTRQHYAEEAMQYYEKTKQKSTETSDLVINGHQLDGLTCEDRVKTLQAAIHTFSVMEVVAVRVQELIDEMTKDAKADHEKLVQDNSIISE